MRWLSKDKQPWLLLLDNANGKTIDLNEYIPTGNRDSILIMTVNPEHRMYQTVASKKVTHMR